jgi:hypothetical protein
MKAFSLLVALIYFTLEIDALKLVCEKIFSRYNDCITDGFDSFDKNVDIYCDAGSVFYNLIIFPNRRLALESGTQLILNDCSIGQLVLSNFGCFSVETSILVEYYYIELHIYNSDFVFDSFEKENFTQNFFNLNKFQLISFRNDIRYPKQETSNLVFKNSFIDYLYFFELSNSSAKRNYFAFKKEQNKSDFNSKINLLELHAYKITLSSKILDEDIFKELKKLFIFNQLEYIEPDTFRPFENLTNIYFDFYSLKTFFHRGVRWMQNLKPKNTTNTLSVYFTQNTIPISSTNYYYPDEDFCLFKYFPYQRPVGIFPDICVNSCTFLWLTQNRQPSTVCTNLTRLDCNFTQLLANCESVDDYRIDNANYNYAKYEYLSDKYYMEKKLNFFLSILVFPIVCILGCALNLLNVLVLSNKMYKKELKQRMYDLMRLSSLINFFVCFIYLFRLTIICIDPINSYCPISIITNKALRYTFLTLVNYFGNVLKTVSNLIQISTSIDRIVLSTEVKSRFFQMQSDIKLKNLVPAFFVFSFAINFIKIFQYDYDLDYENLRFPIISKNYFNIDCWYSYFNFAHIFLNNVCMILVQVLIDLILVSLIRKSFGKLKEEMRFCSIKHLQLKNEKIERNIRVMVIMCGLSLFVLHTPDLIISVYMATTYINHISFYMESSRTFIETRTLIFFSFLLNIISDIIYFLGFSLNTLLYYNFNSVFRRSMRDLFS